MHDISQLVLPWDKTDKGLLSKPRERNARNIGRLMVWIGPTSPILNITTFALMWFVFSASNEHMQTLLQSGWFVEGLLSQTPVVHMLRTQKIPFIQSTTAWPALMMTSLIMAIGIYVPFSPLGPLVGLQALLWQHFPWLVGTLFVYCCVTQDMKTPYIRRFGQWYQLCIEDGDSRAVSAAPFRQTIQTGNVMEKQHSLVFLIKNKIIVLTALFLMKITHTLRVRALAWCAGGKINYQHTKALLNLASTIHRFSIRLLRFTSPPALQRGNL